MTGGKDKHEYSRFFFVYPNKTRREERAHRVALCIQKRVFPNDLPKIDEFYNKVEASHLCHNNSCVEVSHIVMETHELNMERNHCREQGFCTKSHKPYCLM